MKFVCLNSHERTFLALEQGLYAAGLIPRRPSIFRGKSFGFNSLARARRNSHLPEDGLIATVKKSKSKPDEVKRVIRAGIKANRYIRTHARERSIFDGMAGKSIGNGERQLRQRRAGFQRRRRAAGRSAQRLIIDRTEKTAKVEREIPLKRIADLDPEEKHKRSWELSRNNRNHRAPPMGGGHGFAYVMAEITAPCGSWITQKRPTVGISLWSHQIFPPSCCAFWRLHRRQ